MLAQVDFTFLGAQLMTLSHQSLPVWLPLQIVHQGGRRKGFSTGDQVTPLRTASLPTSGQQRIPRGGDAVSHRATYDRNRVQHTFFQEREKCLLCSLWEFSCCQAIFLERSNHIKQRTWEGKSRLVYTCLQYLSLKVFTRLRTLDGSRNTAPDVRSGYRWQAQVCGSWRDTGVTWDLGAQDLYNRLLWQLR